MYTHVHAHTHTCTNIHKYAATHGQAHIHTHTRTHTYDGEILCKSSLCGMWVDVAEEVQKAGHRVCHQTVPSAGATLSICVGMRQAPEATWA